MVSFGRFEGYKYLTVVGLELAMGKGRDRVGSTGVGSGHRAIVVGRVGGEETRRITIVVEVF